MLGMQLIVFSLLLAVVTIGFLWYAYRVHQRIPLHVWGMVVTTCTVAIAMYSVLGQPVTRDEVAQAKSTTKAVSVSEQALAPTQTLQARIETLQDQLREDTQNGELWYALGNVYMYNNDFDSAGTAFLYASRLAPEPQSNIFSAMASASYYELGQQFTAESEGWIQQALTLDPSNISALMLLASDYFLNARYQKAIDTWQMALDTEQVDLDRVAIINAINQAKSLL